MPYHGWKLLFHRWVQNQVLQALFLGLSRWRPSHNRSHSLSVISVLSQLQSISLNQWVVGKSDSECLVCLLEVFQEMSDVARIRQLASGWEVRWTDRKVVVARWWQGKWRYYILFSDCKYEKTRLFRNLHDNHSSSDLDVAHGVVLACSNDHEHSCTGCVPKRFSKGEREWTFADWYVWKARVFSLCT